MFVQHSKFGITLEVDKKFLNYHSKTTDTVANSAETAEKTVSPEAVARAARMAAAAKKQAKAKQAAAAKAKAKAKKASEKEEMRLLAEAVKAVKAVKAAEAAVAKLEVAKSVAVKPQRELSKVEDEASEKVAEAVKAEAVRVQAAKVEAEATEAKVEAMRSGAARPLVVQARSSLALGLSHMQSRIPAAHAATHCHALL